MAHDDSPGRPIILVDVLGTLVDQFGSLRARVGEATGWRDAQASRAVRTWLDLVSGMERDVSAGAAPFVPSHALDAAALARMASDGTLPAEAVPALTDAAHRLEPWPDTVEGLRRIAEDATVVGLSNASHRVLTGLRSSSGMHWDQAISAEDAGAYKPDPRIYRTALANVPPGSGAPYMVAAHAWDLRAAARAGMRTAYVPRPGGDPPTNGDSFDIRAADLLDLRAQLRS